MITRRSIFSLLGCVPVIAVTACLAQEAKGLTLDAARRIVEAPFRVKKGFGYSLCETGERYIALCAGGIKPEGSPFQEYFASEAEAVKVWLRSALIYAQGKSGTLYWREMPIAEARYSSETKQTGWQVYSRLIITDGSVQFASEDDCRNAEGYVINKKWVNLRPHYSILSSDGA